MGEQVFNPSFQDTIKILLWPSPCTVFEIGVCEAEDTLRYAKLFPFATFYLFEPLRQNHKIIQKKLAHHKEIKAKLYRYALSNRAGMATFYVSSGFNKKDGQKGNKSSSLLKPEKPPKSLRWLKFNKKEIVKTITLDEFCNEQKINNIDFLHMDAQGAELQILKGGYKTLPKIRVIWMEVAFQKTYKMQPLESEVSDWMRKRGFRKIHQQTYGPEGDALYLNMHHYLSWPLFFFLRSFQRVSLLNR